MPNTLHEKALKQPFRVGMILGALALPSLWIVWFDLILLLSGERVLNAGFITFLFVVGTWPGMILGAGAVRAWAAWRNNEKSEARWILLSYGTTVSLILLAFYLFYFWRFFNNWPDATAARWLLARTLILATFPLHCSLTMLLFGLFMRSPRR